MDKLFLFSLGVIAFVLAFAGTGAIVYAKGKVPIILAGIFLIGLAVLIAYGIDTQCPRLPIYGKC